MPGLDTSREYSPAIGSSASSTGEIRRENLAQSSTSIVPSAFSAMICSTGVRAPMRRTRTISMPMAFASGSIMSRMRISSSLCARMAAPSFAGHRPMVKSGFSVRKSEAAAQCPGPPLRCENWFGGAYRRFQQSLQAPFDSTRMLLARLLLGRRRHILLDALDRLRNLTGLGTGSRAIRRHLLKRRFLLGGALHVPGERLDGAEIAARAHHRRIEFHGGPERCPGLVEVLKLDLHEPHHEVAAGV